MENQDINTSEIAETLNNKVDLPSDPSKAQDEIDFVVSWQKPTEANGYTWYRLYKSGWVEQGCNKALSKTSFDLVLPMEDTNYHISFAPSDTYYVVRITGRNKNSFTANGRCIDNSGLNGNASIVCWEVKGYAAQGE